ncbi:MAG: hypothetical protein ACK5LC_03570 [Coprobacillaceae bacterium]
MEEQKLEKMVNIYYSKCKRDHILRSAGFYGLIFLLLNVFYLTLQHKIIDPTIALIIFLLMLGLITFAPAKWYIIRINTNIKDIQRVLYEHCDNKGFLAITTLALEEKSVKPEIYDVIIQLHFLALIEDGKVDEGIAFAESKIEERDTLRKNEIFLATTAINRALLKNDDVNIEAKYRLLNRLYSKKNFFPLIYKS